MKLQACRQLMKPLPEILRVVCVLVVEFRQGALNELGSATGTAGMKRDMPPTFKKRFISCLIVLRSSITKVPSGTVTETDSMEPILKVSVSHEIRTP